jgi:carbon monoxide dehydrogenase subunit G
MKITNEFTVHTPIDRTWQMLTDLEGIAPCLPGAMLTGVDGDVYKGKVKVKVGPVVSEFAGTARFAERDETAHRAVIDAKGRDARAAGNATALVTAVLRAEGTSTVVSVETDLTISGKLAQFGNRMINEVSGKLLAQFVSNLEAKLAAEDAAPPPATPPETPPAAGPAAEPVSVAETASADGTAVNSTPRPPAPGAGSLPVRSAEATPAAPPRPAVPDAAPAGEPEALDLLSIAGGSIYKRLVPVVVGVVVVGVVIAWLVVRR